MNAYEKKVCELIKTSSNFNEVARKLNVSTGGNTYKELKKIAEKYNISIDHFCTKYKSYDGKKEILKPEDIFVQNSNRSSSNINRYIKKFNIKEHVCEICGNTEWFGNPIPLQIHHINGDTTDNRLENLQYLCPNCHALTDNYCGKNITKSKHNKETYNKKINKEKEIERERIEKRNDEIKEKIKFIHSLDVDFSKWGWVGKVAKLCGTNRTRLKEFMEIYDKHFYDKCYNKNKAMIKTIDFKNEQKTHKAIKNENIEKRKNIIIDSGIKYSTYGWQTKLSEILGISRHSVDLFLKKHMKDFYNT